MEMTQLSNHYQYLVIGAGPAGLTTAIGLARGGKQVLLVSKNLGGDCTNFGCIPSKRLLHISKSMSFESLDNDSIWGDIRSTIASIHKGEVSQLKSVSSNLDFRFGVAKFLGVNKAEISLSPDQNYFNAEQSAYGSGNHIVSFNKAIIAVGTSPAKIDLPGVDSKKIYTNETIFSLALIPSRVCIVGGGAIGTELAFAFARLGTKASIITRSRLIPFEPKEISEYIAKELKTLGVNIFEYSEFLKQEPTGQILVRSLKQGKKDPIALPATDKYLLAIGRSQNHVDLNLYKAKVAVSKDGIIVNRNFITNNPNIYAIGDCIGGSKHTHLAYNQATFVVRREIIPLFRLPRSKVVVPRLTFTEPAVGSVGKTSTDWRTIKFELDLTETDSALLTSSIDTETTNNHSKELDLADNESVVKKPTQKDQLVVFCDVYTRKIVGFSAVGDGLVYSIHLYTQIIQSRLKVENLFGLITVYPTPLNKLDQIPILYLQYWQGNWKSLLINFLQRYWSSFLLGFIWILLIALGIYFTVFEEVDIGNLVNISTEFLRSPLGVVSYIAVYTLRSTFMLSSTVFTLLAPAIYGFWLSLMLVFIASNLSASWSYLLGRLLFRVDKNKSQTTITNKQKTITENYWLETMKEQGFVGILFARLAFAPFDLVSFVAGSIKIPYWNFLLASMIGSLPGTILFLTVSAGIWRSSDIQTLVFTYIPIAIVIFVVSLFIKANLWRFWVVNRT